MGTPARYYSSTAVTTTLSSSIGASDTALTVASSSGFPSSYPFTLILEKDSANEEIVTVTSLVGSKFSDYSWRGRHFDSYAPRLVQRLSTVSPLWISRIFAAIRLPQPMFTTSVRRQALLELTLRRR